MANFCSNCGSPASGRFCAACGAAIAEPPPPVQAQPPSPGPVWTGAPNASPPNPGQAGRAGGRSAAKIILILVGVVVLLGATGVAGLVYAGYRAKQKIAELKQEYGVSGSAADGTASSTRQFPPPKGSGCSFLQGQEAASILGVAVDRVELEKDGSDGSPLCRYWINATERKRLLRTEIASGIKGADKADQSDPTKDTDPFEKLIGGALGVVIEGAGENKDTDPAMQLQVWESRGQAMWDKMAELKANAGGVPGTDLISAAVQPVAGVGDRAMVLPAGHSIMVLKGDQFFLLGFQQFVPGREKTAALAKAVAGRL